MWSAPMGSFTFSNLSFRPPPLLACLISTPSATFGKRLIWRCRCSAICRWFDADAVLLQQAPIKALLQLQSLRARVSGGASRGFWIVGAIQNHFESCTSGGTYEHSRGGYSCSRRCSACADSDHCCLCGGKTCTEDGISLQHRGTAATAAGCRAVMTRFYSWKGWRR